MMAKFKLTGYLLFANEYKKRHNLYFHNQRELIEAVGPFWNELPDDQKEMYKEKAKNQNKSRKRIHENPTLVKIDQKKIRFEEERNERKQRVEDVVYSASDLGELDDRIFHFIYISTYFEDSNDVHPAELGLLKFSLRRGIIDTLHIKMSCGKLPSGSAFAVKEKSESTHKYTSSNEDDNDDSESNFILVLLKIMDFLDLDEEMPIFFTEEGLQNKELMLVQRALIKIFKGAGEYQIASTLKVYSVIDLFYYLNKVQADDNTDKIGAFKSYTMAGDEFSRAESLFKYLAKGCAFHEYLDISCHCAVSKVICYAHIISKFCVNPAKYPLIEGNHFPKVL